MTVNSLTHSENGYPPTLYHSTHLLFKPCLCLYLGNFCLWHNWITRSGCERWGLFEVLFASEVPMKSLWVHLSFLDVLGIGFQPEWRTAIFGCTWGSCLPVFHRKELCCLPLCKPPGCNWKGKDDVALLFSPTASLVNSCAARLCCSSLLSSAAP